MKCFLKICVILLIQVACSHPTGVPSAQQAATVSDSVSGLNPKVISLNLTYIPYGCACANWVIPADQKKYSAELMPLLSIYIEPADPSLELPDTIGFLNDLVRFTGQFYKQPGFPKGYRSEQHPEKARVFRYTAFDVLKSNYDRKDHQ